jgi:hypothetical protein
MAYRRTIVAAQQISAPHGKQAKGRSQSGSAERNNQARSNVRGMCKAMYPELRQDHKARKRKTDQARGRPDWSCGTKPLRDCTDESRCDNCVHRLN